MLPYSEGEILFQGYLAYLAYYPLSYTVTLLEGPQYGLQLVFNYWDELIVVNPYPLIERTRHGLRLRHEYLDSSIITGDDQFVLLK